MGAAERPADHRPEPVPVAGTLLDRLHPNGRAFVEQLRNAGPLLLVLDECHHLLEVWGRLIGELLDQLPNALVLGLTATPPEALTADQALLVDELFGSPLYRVSIPAVVKVGDLAPFVELAWLTTPTPSEDDWLAEEAERFRELITQLTDPSFGSMPFLQWLDARFVASRSPWLTLVKEQPDVCRAVLRLHHVDMIGLPRRRPDAGGAPVRADRRRLGPAGRRLAHRPADQDRAAAGRAGRRSGTPRAAVGRLPVDQARHPPRPQPGRPRPGAERVQDGCGRPDLSRTSTSTSPSGCGCSCSATTNAPAPPCPPT